MTDAFDSMDRVIETLSSSCLKRVRQGDRDAWFRLARVYRPLICWWCRKAGVANQDIDDVAQDVFSSLATGDAQLHSQTFVGLLWKITEKRILDYWRSRARHPQAIDGEALEKLLQDVKEESSRSAEGGLDYATRLVFDAIIQEIRTQFSEVDWQAFWLTAAQQRPVADVAAELRVTANQVYLARTRILRHIRASFSDPFHPPIK